jgi:uncharacterized protein (TIGR03118 family)
MKMPTGYTVRIVVFASLIAVIAAGSLGCPRRVQNSYDTSNLVSNGNVTADHTDANLVNGWGVAFAPTSYAWVANNGTGTSTLYDGAGNPQSLVVTVPTASGIGTGTPTGIVANTTQSFSVSSGVYSAPALFLFATEDGTISGWSPTVDATNAILAIYDAYDNPVYKGLALASTDGGDFLFAADFRNKEVDVFDSQFNEVATGGFVDTQIPNNYAPFGIAYTGGLVYVTYAQQDQSQTDEVAGAGFGYVDTYTTAGVLVQRLIQNTGLNAPWGIAIAPANFGKFSNNLMIGNFGDGTISAYKVSTGAYQGQLKDTNGDVISIDGLWGIAFGNGQHNQPTNTLFFAAGPDDEANGLYGSIVSAK